MQADMPIEEKLMALKSMGTAELRREWERLNGEPPRSYNRQWLYKRLCWMVQAAVFGGLSPQAERRIQELLPEALRWFPIGHTFLKGNDAVLPTKRSLLSSGTIIARKYRGRTLQLLVREDGGFELDGAIYPSLSAAAKGATNSHWNGRLFWLGRERKEDGTSA